MARRPDEGYSRPPRRQVLGEIVRRLGNARRGVVFPGCKDYQPLGIVRGTDLTLDA